MKLSVVIPAYNEEKLLPQCLETLREALEPIHQERWDYEIIVCDNNSTDRTGEIAEANGARVIFEPVNQIAKARNRGASIATGEWILFLDADSFPTKNLIADLTQTMKRPEIIGGGAVVYMDQRDRSMEFFEGLWNRISRTFNWAAGSFVFCRADAFREIDGFDETYFASEEIDLSRRLKRLGRKRRQSMTVLTEHPLKTSGRKLSLYSRKEMASMLLRCFFFPRSTVRSREKCNIWYDGRR